MKVWIKTLRELVKRGYRRDKGLLLISETWKLSPEQVVELDRAA